jgi:triosephosphate isomerase
VPRQTWIGTGWKMNKTMPEAEEYAASLRDFVGRTPLVTQLFIVPPFTVLHQVCRMLEGSPVHVGAQNMHWKDAGACTGEISPGMVKDCGAVLVELGHSERRAEFGETDFTVNRKVLAALNHGLRPLICVGETAADKEFGVAVETVTRQVKIALHGVPPGRVQEVLLAYEPVWAIGDAGTPAEPEYVDAIQCSIRRAIAEVHGDEAAWAIPILYGGSINLGNAADFISQPHVDGLFIGRAAWDVSSFIRLIQEVEKTMLSIDRE